MKLLLQLLLVNLGIAKMENMEKKLKLLDKNKTVYLNGGEEWKREIRVD